MKREEIEDLELGEVVAERKSVNKRKPTLVGREMMRGNQMKRTKQVKMQRRK